MTMSHVAHVARSLGLNLPPTWSGIDAVWPLLEKMKSDGAVVLVKLDGERNGPDDNGPYTVLVSGAPLEGETIRIDAATIEHALSYVLSRYATRVWGIPNPS